MSRLENILAGEKALAKAVLLVLPLVEKYFKDFDGERALIKSGESAKFSKVCSAFREEAIEIVDNKKFRVFAEISVNSVLIRADIASPNNSGSVSYYKETVYFGKVDADKFNEKGTGIFEYAFDEQNYIDSCNEMLEISEEMLEEKKAKIKALKAEIEGIKSSVPYHLHDSLK